MMRNECFDNSDMKVDQDSHSCYDDPALDQPLNQPYDQWKEFDHFHQLDTILGLQQACNMKEPTT